MSEAGGQPVSEFDVAVIIEVASGGLTNATYTYCKYNFGNGHTGLYATS